MFRAVILTLSNLFIYYSRLQNIEFRNSASRNKNTSLNDNKLHYSTSLNQLRPAFSSAIYFLKLIYLNNIFISV